MLSAGPGTGPNDEFDGQDLLLERLVALPLRAIAAMSAAAAARPLAAPSWRMVVSGGVMRLARGTSSKPTTERSSGTDTPSRDAPRTTPYAVASEKHSTAVGRSRRPNSTSAAASPAFAP